VTKQSRPRISRSAEETLAIQDLVVRYGFVMDDRDWDAMDEVFTEDVVMDYRDHETDPPRGLGPLVGREELVHYARDILTHPYQHMVVNQLLTDISDDEVLVRAKALCPIPGRDLLDIEYHFLVLRTAEGWRIKHMKVKRYNEEASPWAAEQFKIWKERGARIA
jgi:hypothetical protein